MLTTQEMLQSAGIVVFATLCFHAPQFIQWLGGLI